MDRQIERLKRLVDRFDRAPDGRLLDAVAEAVEALIAGGQVSGHEALVELARLQLRLARGRDALRSLDRLEGARLLWTVAVEAQLNRARALRLVGEFAGARSAARAAVQITEAPSVRASADVSDLNRVRARAEVEVALAFLQAGDPDVAATALASAAETFASLGAMSDLAAVRIHQAQTVLAKEGTPADAAARFLEQAVSLAREVQQPHVECNALLLLGTSFVDERAVTALDEALALATHLGMKLASAHGLLHRGERRLKGLFRDRKSPSALDRRALEQVISDLDTAADLNRELGDMAQAAHALRLLGDAATLDHRFTLQLDAYCDAAALLEAAGDDQRRAALELMAAKVAEMDDRVHEGLLSLRRARHWFEAHAERDALKELRRTQATLEMRGELFDDAASTFNVLLQDASDPVDRAAALIGLARANAAAHRYKSAVSATDQALAASRQARSTELTIAACVVQAESILQDALDAVRYASALGGELSAARLAANDRQVTKAVGTFQAVLAAAGALPTTEFSARALLGLARSYVQMRLLAEARAHLSAVQSIIETESGWRRPFQAWVLTAAGEISLALGDPAGAELQFAQALSLADEAAARGVFARAAAGSLAARAALSRANMRSSPLPPWVLAVQPETRGMPMPALVEAAELQYLAVSMMDADRPDAAVALANKALYALDDVGGHAKSASRFSEEALSFEPALDLLLDAYWRQLDAALSGRGSSIQDAEDAVCAFESRRARTFRMLGTMKFVAPGAWSELLELLSETLKQQPALAGAIEAIAPIGPWTIFPDHDAVASVPVEVRRRLESLAADLGVIDGRVGRPIYRPTLRHVIKQVRAAGCIVFSFYSPSRNGRVSALIIAPDTDGMLVEIEDLAARTARGLRRFHRGRRSEGLEELGDAILGAPARAWQLRGGFRAVPGGLGGILNRHPGAPLCILPCGALSDVPWSALRYRACGSRIDYLVRDRRVTIADNLYVLGFLPRSLDAAPRRLALALSHATCPSSAAEADRAIAMLAALGVPTRRHDESNPLDASALGRMDLRAAHLHLGTHAFFDPASPFQSRLRLSDAEGEERWLTARDVLDLDLRGSDVVLSACETGKCASRRLIDPISLASAFWAAGARRVVATLWRVADDAAAAWSEAFYDRLGAGTPLADAVREAQLAMLNGTTRDGYSSPEHWAAFQTFGAP